MLSDTALCHCAPQVLNASRVERLIPEWSRDLLAVVITFTFFAAQIPRICLWRLEVEALACKIVLKGRKAGQRC